METLQTAMKLYNVVSNVNDTLAEQPVGELRGNDGSFWPVKYIIKPTFFIALIITVAAGILTQWMVLIGSVPVLLVTGFSWYWMKDLALLKDLDGYLKNLVVIVEEIEKLTKKQKENLAEQKKISSDLEITNKGLEEEVEKFSLSTDKFEQVENTVNEKIAEENETLKKRIEELSLVADKLKLTEEQFEEVKKINGNLQDQASKMEKENAQLTLNLEKMDLELKELKQRTETLEVNANIIDKEEDKMHEETNEITSNVKTLSEINLDLKKRVGETEGQEWKKLGEKKDSNMEKLDEADDKFKSAGNSIENAVTMLSKTEGNIDDEIKNEKDDVDELNENMTEVLKMMHKIDEDEDK